MPQWSVELIKSYLKNRQLKVKVGTATSVTKIETEVPQSSILGPMFFNLYIADLPKLGHRKTAQFADDTAFYMKNRIIPKIAKNLQEDVEILIQWMQKWKIKLNTQKAVVVLFSKKGRKEPLNINIME